MALLAEFHLLQNFAPSNLNRDDTGAPKDAVFGGVRRARISSQCVKRAVRLHFARQGLIDSAALGVRTLRIQARLCELLRTAHHHTEDEAVLARAVAAALGELKLKVKPKKDEVHGHTEYLLFLGDGEVKALAHAIDQGFDELVKEKPGKNTKASLLACIGSARAVDVALFGRMLADDKNFNVDAAAQVAHAISTHRVDRDVDFFTAVDDLAAGSEAVSGMLGTVEFNSSCFYRYAVINLDLLRANLGADAPALMGAALEAFLRGLVAAVPSGKQNTFAAHNPPEFIGAAIRRGEPMNLANAFEKPVHHGESDAGLTAASVKRLQARWQGYGQAFDIDPNSLRVLDVTGVWQGDARLTSVEALVQATLGAYTAASEGR